ncbi:hypothetical protein O181_023329 [Austropuccinia psidii MF-1]|uniref:Uncharacterized protein n=1 Tax=Austropuccinia psidii MF-1 TaxID=1389203 RepID=A0A9Q3CE73_9BASI|nr:hypothetical protein [Austropuccinia psidii MF-1]
MPAIPILREAESAHGLVSDLKTSTSGLEMIGGDKTLLEDVHSNPNILHEAQLPESQPLKSTDLLPQSVQAHEALSSERAAQSSVQVEKITPQKVLLKEKYLQTLQNNIDQLESQLKEIKKLDQQLITIEQDESEVMILHRTLLVQEMKVQGPNIGNWLEKMKQVPQGTSKEIETQWLQLLEEAQKDYKLLRSTGLSHYIKNIFRYFFQNSQWRKAKLDKIIVKLRLVALSQKSPTRETALELARVREAGFTLSPTEERLLQKIGQGRETKLSPAEHDFLIEISEKTVETRREAKLRELTSHFQLLADSYENPQENIEILNILAALKALRSNARESVSPIKEQIELLNKLEDIKTPDEINQKLTPTQKDMIATLSTKTKKLEEHNLYLKALDQIEKDPNVNQELISIQAKLRTTLEGSQAHEGPTFSEQEQTVIREYANRQDEHVQINNALRSSSKLDFSQLRLPDLPSMLYHSNERALQYLTSPGIVLSPNQAKLVAKIRNPKDFANKFPQVKDFAIEFSRITTSLPENDIIGKVLQLVKSNKDQDLVFEQKNVDQLATLSREPNSSPEEQIRKSKAVGFYDQIINSMTENEKAFNYLESKKTSEGLKPDEMKLWRTMKANGVLNFEDKFRVLSYSKLYKVPTLEERAYQRLLTLENSGTKIPEKEALWVESLKHGRVSQFSSEPDKEAIHALALEDVVVRKISATPKAQEFIIQFVEDQNFMSPETHALHIYQHLKEEELSELIRLATLPTNSPEFKDVSKFSKMLVLVNQAEKRSYIDLDMIKAEALSNTKHLLENQYLSREAEKTRLRQLHNQKINEIKAFESFFSQRFQLVEKAALPSPEAKSKEVVFHTQPGPQTLQPETKERISSAGDEVVKAGHGPTLGEAGPSHKGVIHVGQERPSGKLSDEEMFYDAQRFFGR